MIIPRHYENLHLLHEHTMPERAYYVPASKRMEQLVRHREESDRIQFLNANWKFRYYESVYELQEKFYQEDYPCDGFQEIPVPSVWQTQGYDCHQYTNLRYPFPVDPPYVPQENPCGAYVHTFFYKKDLLVPRVYLNFEGVASCFYVWLNGVYVGYSQISHSTSEFDITDYLKEGKNRLAVLVLKWCDGSYLEDQDMFRMNGIFRDVYLLSRPEQAIFDYFTETAIGENAIGEKTAEIRVRFRFLQDVIPIQVHVFDAEGRLAAEGCSRDCLTEENQYQAEIRLTVQNPRFWNAEEPNLYTIVYETTGEVITDRVGIREIHVADCIVYVNGKPIKFRGVNRHDSDPVTGYTVGLEQMEKDLRLMKEYNVNAIRASHYPDVPYFYELCDQYGFYVIDEADNESHGTQALYMDVKSWEERTKKWNKTIADNPDFTEATLDRVKSCVYRNKNRPSIVVWSVGNECAYGCTFEKALEWTKSFDPSRLTHYESACYRSGDRKYDFSNIDLYSRMYQSLEQIGDYLEQGGDKPYLACEYCHAMGNGPGDLEDYFRMIEKHDGICGGFVWEWCDHAIYKGETAEGKKIYFYGGDHGEYPHDGNFCVDGLVYPDRRPHTGLLEFKNVQRPARVVKLNQESGELTLHNYKDFVNLKDYLFVRYEITCDGIMAGEGKILPEEMPSVTPHGEGVLKIDFQVPQSGTCYLKVFYHLAKGTEILPTGYLLGFDELPLKNKDSENRKKLELLDEEGDFAAGFRVAEDDRFLFIEHENFAYTYNKLNGLFEKIVYRQRQILEKPMELNIWRAPTDNDRNLKKLWMEAQYDRSITRAYSTEYHVEDDALYLHSKMSVSAASIQRILTIEAEWTIRCSGKIEMNLKVKRDMIFPELPRFGLRMFLAKEMDEVTYYGIGPMESYLDKCRAGSHGIYHGSVASMHEDYLRPQENGSHADCDYVIVKGMKAGIAAAAYEKLSFNTSEYTQEELTVKAHNYELQTSGYTVLCVDYRQNGIGSNSVSTRLRPEYRLNEESFDFHIKLIPMAF